MDAPAALGMRARAGLESAAVQGRSLPHAGEAPPVGRHGWRTGGAARYGDGYGDLARRAVDDPDVCLGAGSGWLEGVGEGLLDDPVDGELAAGGQGRVALVRVAEGEARGANADEKVVQVGEDGLGCAVGGERRGLVVAEDVEQAAE